MCKKSESVQSQVGECAADTVGECRGGPKVARLCVLITYMTKYSSISIRSMYHQVLCVGKKNCFNALVAATQRVHRIPRTCGSTRACAHVQSTKHVSGLSAEPIVLFMWLKHCLVNNVKRKKLGHSQAHKAACPGACLCPSGHCGNIVARASETIQICSVAVNELFISTDGEQCKENRN